MEQKNEQSVYEVMTKYAGEVIAEMAGEIFTTRNFIEAFVDKHEIIYVEFLLILGQIRSDLGMNPMKYTRPIVFIGRK